MTQFKIFTSPLGKMEAVKQGWSWPAFFFNIIWALTKKMWGIGFGFAVGFFFLGAIFGFFGEGSVNAIVVNLLSLAASVEFGARGNRWREQNLLARGFEHTDTVTAANPEGALALYLKTLSVKA